MGSITAAATASSSESSISSPSPRGCNNRPSAVDSAALPALTRQLALSWSVVAQRHYELVRAEAPIMRIRSVYVRRDAGVELGNEPSDRTARRPLAVGPAVAGRDLDRQNREPSLRFGRQRRRGNSIRTLDGPDTRAGGERQHQAARVRRRQAEVRPQGAPAAVRQIQGWPARSCGCGRQ